MQLDLCSFASIKSFVDKFKTKYSQLDVLINNAGVMFGPRSTSSDGFETQWATNHLGPFLLTNLLIDRLRESKGRVVCKHIYGVVLLFSSIFPLAFFLLSFHPVTSSCVHQFGKGSYFPILLLANNLSLGAIDLEDLQAEKYYSPYRAYSQSKLASILFA
jgi:NAD(P)-dependent dehydrogenase (short-subunit alcohol dehydrogenase family)